MNRRQVRYDQDVIVVTKLTSRILARSGRALEITEENLSEGATENNGLEWEDAVALKDQLTERWNELSGEEIIEKLDSLWAYRETDVPKLDLQQTPELWLLKALAQEKCLYTDILEIEETYRHCHNLGNWNSVLIRNNLAVLQARGQECADSLKLLVDAIRLALAHRIHLKAPFYNAALIFQQLHEKRLILEPCYLSVLDETAQLISLASQNLEPSELLEFRSDSTILSWRDSEITTAYKSIAEYAFRFDEPQEKSLFQESATYLAPYLDFFESFGNVADKTDTRTAHKFFEQGISYSDEKRFADGILSFKMAGDFDPALSLEVAKKTQQVSDEWRYELNQQMVSSLGEGKYDEASHIIRNPPEDRLKRPSDDAVISTIEKLKHSALLEEADVISHRGSDAEAKLIYINLLRQPNLGDSMRIHVSGKLAAPLRHLSDDAERHRDLNELVSYGLHPQVVESLSAEFESVFVREAINFSQTKQYDLAIQKYLWSLLLPNRPHRREELMQLAVFTFDLMQKNNPNPDGLTSLQNPIFADLKSDLEARWRAKQNRTTVERFERLDGEPWLTKKQIDELLVLLDELISYEPTAERLVAKLRLPREKEAQQLFTAILGELEAIAKEGDHSKRRDRVYGGLRELHNLAIDFAAGEHARYAQQITDFVVKTEDYFAQADGRKYMQEMSLEINENREKEFAVFKETLRTSEDEVRILEVICKTFRMTLGTVLYEQTNNLSSYWFEQLGKPRYQALTTGDQNRARSVIRNSLAVIERDDQVLPDAFRVNFKSFLQGLVREPEPQPEAVRVESTPPPPVPSPQAEGFIRRFIQWVKVTFD